MFTYLRESFCKELLDFFISAFPGTTPTMQPRGNGLLSAVVTLTFKAGPTVTPMTIEVVQKDRPFYETVPYVPMSSFRDLVAKSTFPL